MPGKIPQLTPLATRKQLLLLESELNRVQLLQEVGDFNWVHGEESTRDIHDYVLMAVLVLLLCEQALALRLSYHPKTAGGRT